MSARINIKYVILYFLASIFLYGCKFWILPISRLVPLLLCLKEYNNRIYSFVVFLIVFLFFWLRDLFLNTKMPPNQFSFLFNLCIKLCHCIFNIVAFTQKFFYKLGYRFNNAKQYIENHVMLYNTRDHYHSNINSAPPKNVILLHSSLLHKACMYKHTHTHREKLGYFASILIFLRNFTYFYVMKIYMNIFMCIVSM